MRLCSRAADLVLYGPGEAVGIAAWMNATDDLEGFKVNDSDVVVGSAGDVGTLAIRLHEDASGTAADR